MEIHRVHLSFSSSDGPPDNRPRLCYALLLSSATSVLAEHSIRIPSTCDSSRYVSNCNDTVDYRAQHEGEPCNDAHRHQSRTIECLAPMGRIPMLVPLFGARSTILYTASLAG
jgi:hypothetical protein